LQRQKGKSCSYFFLSLTLSSQTGALCLQHMLRCWLLQKC
jgi:hypothetical protein